MKKRAHEYRYRISTAPTRTIAHTDSIERARALVEEYAAELPRRPYIYDQRENAIVR